MHYRYTGTIDLYDLEGNHLPMTFEFVHEEQLIHCFVKHYALNYIFNNNLAPASYCRIGTMGYKMTGENEC